MINRNFSLVILGNVVLGAAMPMLIILGALAGGHLAPVPSLATAPPSAQMIAGIGAALMISQFMARHGRRAGFLLGAGLVVIGGMLGAFALMRSSFGLLMLAHVVLGGALTGVNFFRFVAAEVVAREWRPQAMSITLASGLFAALLGPTLFDLTKDQLSPVPFAGAYLAIAGLGVVGAGLVAGLQGLGAAPVRASVPRGETLAILRRGPVAMAIFAAAVSMALMVLMMVPTPLAMIGCGFGEAQAADVIRWHVVAMFAPGFFTGALITRFGAIRVVQAGFVLFGVAAVIAMLDVRIGNFYAGLIVLGLAWNFGYTGGTALLQDAVTEAEKGRVQGINDMLVATAASLASLGSGAVYAGLGWAAIAVATLPVVALAMIIVRGRAAPA